MPIYRSRAAGVDNSKLEEGLNSIAAIFKPPSAQEVYAGARAQAEREEASRLADAYAYAADPNYSRDMAERKMFALGKVNGTNGYYAQDANNRTQLQINTDDNRRALQQTAMQERGQLDRAIITPRAANTVQDIPTSIASAYGIPETRMGVLELDQGKNYRMPTGETVAGPAKPLTKAEVEGAILAGASPEVQQASILSASSLGTTLGPDGKTPIYQTGPQMIGQRAVPDPQKVAANNYKAPDGSEGTARFGGDAIGYVDTQTGLPIPRGSKLFTASLQGTAADTGLGKATMNDVQGQLLDVANTELAVDALEKIALKDPGAIGATGYVQGTVQDIAATANEVISMLSPQMKTVAQDVQAGLMSPEVAGRFNDNIPKAQLAENMLVYAYAKMQSPDGRVSNQGMDAATRALGGGGLLQNAPRMRAALSGIREQIAAKRAMLGPTAPAAAALGTRSPNATSPVLPDRAPPSSTQTGTPNPTPGRLRYNLQTGEFE